MENRDNDRRKNKRFGLRLTLRYKLSKRGVEERWNTAITRDMSREGLVFKTRHALPVGAHLEMHIDWPARYESVYPVDLQATGFVMRSERGRTAVRMTSHRFLVNAASAEAPLGAIA